MQLLRKSFYSVEGFYIFPKNRYDNNQHPSTKFPDNYDDGAL